MPTSMTPSGRVRVVNPAATPKTAPRSATARIVGERGSSSRHASQISSSVNMPNSIVSMPDAPAQIKCHAPTTASPAAKRHVLLRQFASRAASRAPIKPVSASISAPKPCVHQRNGTPSL